jgi:hypothetical protein
MKKLFYEVKPWIFIAVAGLGMVNTQGSRVGSTSSVLLLGCALIILQWRFEYRRALKRQRY